MDEEKGKTVSISKETWDQISANVINIRSTVKVIYTAAEALANNFTGKDDDIDIQHLADVLKGLSDLTDKTFDLTDI